MPRLLLNKLKQILGKYTVSFKLSTNNCEKTCYLSMHVINVIEI